ncbi:hypothetical protein [Pseudomonas peli]
MRVRFSGDYGRRVVGCQRQGCSMWCGLEPLMIGGIYPKTSKIAS